MSVKFMEAKNAKVILTLTFGKAKRNQAASKERSF